MTIAFDTLISTPVPGSQVEFSNVRAISGLPAAQQKILLIGMRSNAGLTSALTPLRIVSKDQAAQAFGRGSMLHAMVIAALDGNSTTELWAVALDENAAGVAATWTITLTGPSTAAGTLAYMIAGQRLQVGVATGDTATAMAANVAAAVNAALDLPVSATSAAAVVTLTARHKGTYGNEIDVRQNHFQGERLPAGVTSTIAAAVAGATNPDVTTVFAAIGDSWFQNIATGINDPTNLTACDTEMVSRWGPARQREGRVYAAFTGTLSATLTFGATRNGIFTTVVGCRKVPSPTWKVAAHVCAVAALSLAADPARPLTNLALPGLVGPLTTDAYTATERAQLLNTGISTLKLESSGQMVIERLISCYQLDAYGLPDGSYRDIQTTATLGYIRFAWRQRMSQKFPRAKLTADTIASVKAETIALARDMADAELLEDVEGFIAGLVIERDGTVPTQLNLLMTPNIVNPLLQFAARIEFIL